MERAGLRLPIVRARPGVSLPRAGGTTVASRTAETAVEIAQLTVLVPVPVGVLPGGGSRLCQRLGGVAAASTGEASIKGRGRE